MKYIFFFLIFTLFPLLGFSQSIFLKNPTKANVDCMVTVVYENGFVFQRNLQPGSNLRLSLKRGNKVVITYHFIGKTTSTKSSQTVAPIIKEPWFVGLELCLLHLKATAQYRMTLDLSKYDRNHSYHIFLTPLIPQA